MTFAALAALAGLLWWLWREPRLRRMLARGAWRPALAAVVLAGLVGAVAASLRGAWPIGLASLAISLWAGLFVRRRPDDAHPVASRTMSATEARALLGVDESAGAAEIEEAYRRLMRRAHPDLGGSTGLAAQLNAARAVLVRR